MKNRRPCWMFIPFESKDPNKIADIKVYIDYNCPHDDRGFIEVRADFTSIRNGQLMHSGSCGNYTVEEFKRSCIAKIIRTECRRKKRVN